MKYKIILLAFTLISVTACVNLRSGIFVENDRVMKTRKVTYEAYFYSNQKYEQSYSQKITFLKETDRNNITNYTLYDVITLPVESFDLDDKMYIVADDNVIKLPVSTQNQYNTKNINEQKNEILQSDSTKITVVTGYDVVNKKTIQMTHPINDDILQKILQAHELHLRYYVGPNAINSEIKGTKLRNIKKWILK